MEEAPQVKNIAILNSKDRLFGSWGTVEIRDKQGEIIPINAFLKTMNTMLKRQAPITIKHTNKIVGKVINMEAKKNDKYDSDGIYITGLIYNDYKLEDDTWSKIQTGEYTGISVGGQQSVADQNGDVAWIEPCEFALTENPANPGALIEVVAMTKEQEIDRNTDEWKKEREEHPDFPDIQIDQIIIDHEKERLEKQFDPSRAVFRLDQRITPVEMAENPMLFQAIVGDMIRQSMGAKLTDKEKRNIEEYNALIMKKDAEDIIHGETEKGDETMKKEEVTEKKPEVPKEEKPVDKAVEAPAPEAPKEEVSDDTDKLVLEKLSTVVEMLTKVSEMLSAGQNIAKEAPKEKEEKKPEEEEKCTKEESKEAKKEDSQEMKKEEAVSTSIVPRPDANAPYVPMAKDDGKPSAKDIALGRKSMATIDMVRE